MRTPSEVGLLVVNCTEFLMQQHIMKNNLKANCDKSNMPCREMIWSGRMVGS